MLYAAHEDEFDQEDQQLLDRIAARYTITTPAPVDPMQAWISEQAQLFSKCLSAAARHLPDATPEDRRHAATVLFQGAAARLELVAA